MNPEFKPLYECFKRNGWQWEYSDDLAESIMVRQKGDMYLYNYADRCLVVRNHPVVVKCRGLVVREDGTLLNYPFERFFNDWEKECATIDWNTAVVQEKVDGSLICVFWNGKEWEITTRGSFYPLAKADVDFAELFKNHFKAFEELDKDSCYMFELVTKQNRIVKQYDEEGVYLLGARNIKRPPFLMFEQERLENLAVLMWIVKLPKIYSAKCVDDCKKLFADFKPDDEGVVVVDAAGNRIKIKQESYLRLSKLMMLKDQDILDYVMGKTTIDAEYVNKLPEVQEKIDKIKEELMQLSFKVQWTYSGIIRYLTKDGKEYTRKDFALEAIKHPYKSLLFSMFDGKDIKNAHIDYETMKGWLK